MKPVILGRQTWKQNMENRITQDQISRITSYFESINQFEDAPEGKWNAKEIIGHLIDSGINNLFRYHRILINNEKELVGYSQDELVAFQEYKNWDYSQLVNTWKHINQLILNFTQNTPADKLSTSVNVEGAVLTLEEMFLDYTQHIDHHVKQIEALQV